jgi:hypothetical protein
MLTVFPILPGHDMCVSFVLFAWLSFAHVYRVFPILPGHDVFVSFIIFVWFAFAAKASLAG